MNRRYRIEFTIDTEKEWSDEIIEKGAIQELECMAPFPTDITFSVVSTEEEASK